MSVRRAQLEIHSDEFSEWIVYNRLEPFGEERADLRSAIVASVFANINRGKGQREFKVEDFMPKFNEQAKPKQSLAQMRQIFGSFASAHNASQKRGKK